MAKRITAGVARPMYVVGPADLKQNGGRWGIQGGPAVAVFNLGESGQSTKFGDVLNGNYAEFEANGFLVFYGSARAWIDFNFGVNALTRGAAAPDLITVPGTGIQTIGFNGVNTLEQVSVGMELNHNWAEGTLLYPHVHWAPTTTAAGDVVWYLEIGYTHAGVFVDLGTLSVTQAAGGVAWSEQYVAFPAISTPGLTIGTQIAARFYRDPTIGADDYGADAALTFSFGFHVLIDTLGSRLQATK